MTKAEAFTVRLGHDELRLGPVRVSFRRTLRVPEAGLSPLPPSLGRFPLRRVEDYPDTAPAAWRARGGVMLPIHQREAMWLSLDADEPAALQVGTGQVCAVSGAAWSESLRRRPQNYLPVPAQPWLDGINAGDGFVRQFVATPLGSGASVEEQVTGQALHGGVQLRSVGLTAAALAEWNRLRTLEPGVMAIGCGPDMGLGAGGRVRQQVFVDRRRLADYDPRRACRVFVHLCSAAQWTSITGEAPPPTPVDREAYVQAGLPWFDYFDADATDLPPAPALRAVKPVAGILGEPPSPITPVVGDVVVVLNGAGGIPVQGGTW